MFRQKDKGVDVTRDIQPMTTFRNHSAQIMEHLKATKRPVILTVNGKAAAVVQNMILSLDQHPARGSCFAAASLRRKGTALSDHLYNR